MESLSDLKTPSPIEVPLLRGKKAVVGAFNMEVLCWVEEKYGSWEDFQAQHLGAKTSNMRAISEFLFQLLENQDDFADLTEFRRCFDLGAIGALLEAMNSQIHKAMVPVPKKGKGGADSEGAPSKK